MTKSKFKYKPFSSFLLLHITPSNKPFDFKVTKKIINPIMFLVTKKNMSIKYLIVTDQIAIEICRNL